MIVHSAQLFISLLLQYLLQSPKSQGIGTFFPHFFAVLAPSLLLLPEVHTELLSPTRITTTITMKTRLVSPLKKKSQRLAFLNRDRYSCFTHLSCRCSLQVIHTTFNLKAISDPISVGACAY